MGFFDWVRQVFVGGGASVESPPAEAPPAPAPTKPVAARAPDGSDIGPLGFEPPTPKPTKVKVVRGKMKRSIEPVQRKKKNKDRNTRPPGFGGPQSEYTERPRVSPAVSVPPDPARTLPPTLPVSAAPAPAPTPMPVSPRMAPPTSPTDLHTTTRLPALAASTDVSAATDFQTTAPRQVPLGERPTEARDVRPPVRTTREKDTLTWVVLPKFEALLRQVDDALANPSAERSALVSARSRFEREWRALLPLPRSEAERLDGEYRARRDRLVERIGALPDPRAEEEARHLAERAALVVEAEQLANFDLHAAIAKARTLQRAWRDAGRVSKEAMGEFGPRFKAAMDAVYARRDDDRVGKVQRLQALVDQAEVLGRSKDPVKAAEAMKQLQAKWKETGGIRGEQGDALWTRFRAAADAVFAQRKATFEQKDSEAVAAREALIAQANALAAEGVEDADETIRNLNAKWRRLPMPPRDKADALWAEFKAACDRLRSPPPIAAEALGDAGALRFNPFAALGGEKGE